MGWSDALRAGDLRDGRGVALVEELGRCARSLVRQAASSGRLVVYRQGIHGVQRTAWFRDAVAGGHAREFSYFPFPAFVEYWRADDVAFDAVEIVYAVMKQQGKVPAAPLVELYGDETVEAAFKKQLLARLAEFFRTVAAIKLLSDDGRSVEFYPSAAWEEVCHWVNLARVPWELPVGVTVIRTWKLNLGSWLGPWTDWIWLGYLIALPFWVLACVRRVTWSAGPPEPIQVGLRVYTTDWGFRGKGSREIDWLLDGKELHRHNTLFVIEKSVPEEYRAEFGRRGYRFTDVSRRGTFRHEAFRVVSWRFFVRELIFRGGWAWLRFVAARPAGMFRDVAARGWLEYLRWTAFLEHWRPRHYVVYNHLHFEHLFRNARLRSVGCTTWYYVHSVHDRCAFFDGSPDRAIRTQVNRAYLTYDCEVHWDARYADTNRRMRGGSRNYLVLGPLWSADVRSVPSVRALLDERLKSRRVDSIVAVFDTSFGSASPYGQTEATGEFYEAIVAMLDQPNWASRILLFKPKSDPEVLCDQVSGEVIASMARLKKHPRCVWLPVDVAPGAVIAEADLAISILHTSTTREALGARRRAFYFDPGGRFPESYYDRFPNLVAHDRNTLARLCEHWLRMSDADFRKYADHYLAPEFGGHLDACADERFRTALTAGGIIP